jgi:DNA invertase Pin-like site-specific DNA recombinase
LLSINVTEAALVLDGYIRVSQVGEREGESFISPQVQLEQIKGWIKGRGDVQLGEVFKELNESGGRRDRPDLLRALDRVENGESEGVIVAKIDRFGRRVIDGLRAIKRIEQAGGTFVSVQDGIDLSAPTGKFVMQVLFSIGEWELERVRVSWDEAARRAVERGVYVAQAPFGYLLGEDGRLRIDPERAPVVREIFARRADRQSCKEIAAALNAAGVRSARGGEFSAGTIQRMIANPAYYGEAYHGAHRNPTAHEPLVDEGTWHWCQEKRRPRGRAVPSLLGGMVRCATCGYAMTAAEASGPGSRLHAYRCGNRAKDCRRPAYVRGNELDPLVEEFVFRKCREPWSGDARREIEACEAAIEQAREALGTFRDSSAIEAALSVDIYAEGLAARQRMLDQRLIELGRARRRGGIAGRDLGELERIWPKLDWQGRREEIGWFVDCVVVEPGEAPVRERARVFRSGRGPVQRRGQLRIDRRALAEDGELLPRHERWPRERIESRLGVFLEGRKEWPPYREFAAAGEARLYAQAMRWDGFHNWGRRFGLSIPEKEVRWSSEVIGDALAAFLEGRSCWPRPQEFEDAGLTALYEAIRYQGVRGWALRCGMEYGQRRIEWTERRVEVGLKEFTKGRKDFPTKAEFFAADLRTLYDAACRTGGIASWCARLGLRPATRPYVLAAKARREAGRLRERGAAVRRSVAPAPRGGDLQLPGSFDPAQDGGGLRGPGEGGEVEAVEADRPGLGGEGDIAGDQHAALLDLDGGVHGDQLEEDRSDVVAAADRGRVGGDQAGVAGEAGGRGGEVAGAEGSGEGD